MALILFALLSAASGCKRPGEQTTMDQFLSFLQNGEYPRIYQLLTQNAQGSISLADLSKRYEDIYSSLALTKVECKLKNIRAVDGERKNADFTLSATSSKLGAFSLDMTAPLRWENGKWLIDWTSELILPGLEAGCKVQLNPTPASRGEIFDASGEVLAKNGYAETVYVDTSKVKDYETLIRLLAPVINMTEKDVRSKLKNAMKADASPSPAPSASASPPPSPSPSPTPQAADQPGVFYAVKAYPQGSLTQEQLDAIKQIPGADVSDTMTVIRTYPYGDLLAHTLGYTGVMTAEDLKKPENAGLPQDAVIGRTGLEAAFEQDMRGQAGYDLVIEDAKGTKTTLVHKAPVDGRDLRLTIDIELQQQAEMLLREYLTTPGMAGTIIVTDPKTGYIQAMAVAPSYDPNLFSFPLDPDVWKWLNDKANNNPLMDRATTGLYPPGSTFKPFTASMGLTDKAITPNTVFPYTITNDTWIPGDAFGISSPIRRAETTPGNLNLRSAIIHSDNIFFAFTALKVGADSFYKHCLDFGLSKPMPFDLPVKTSKISNTEKIKDVRTLADSGYGQGELVITPVQMAAMFGALDNGGDVMLPRVVQSICHDDGPRYVVDKQNPKEVWLKGIVPQENLDILIPDLKLVAEQGTARDINKYKDLRDYGICAKTGTAEVGTDKTREIAWLIGFTTKTMDRLVCVTLEVPADGGGIRIDIAKRMFCAQDSKQKAEAAEKAAATKKP